MKKLKIYTLINMAIGMVWAGITGWMFGNPAMDYYNPFVGAMFGMFGLVFLALPVAVIIDAR